MRFLKLVLITWLMGQTLHGDWMVQRIVSLEYPALAIQARMQGDLLIEGTVTRGGQVVSAKIIRDQGLTDQGRSILGNAAVKNIKEWTFKRGSGSVASSKLQVIYHFKLTYRAGATRRTRFIFEFPNAVYVESEYMPAMP